jgi:hypothetical protein
MGDAGGQWEEFEKVVSQITHLDQLVLAGEAASDSYDGEERRFLDARDQLCENHFEVVIELLEARRKAIIAQEIDLSAVPPVCCRRGHQTTRLPALDARGKGRCDECGDVVGLHDVVDFCVLKGEDEHDDCNFYCCKACTLRLSEEVEEAKEVCLHHQHATAQPHITDHCSPPCSTHVYR